MRQKRHDESVLSTDFTDSEAIGSLVENLWTNRSATKYSLERQWYQNIAWYMGLQNLVWYQSANKLKEPDSPSWRVRLVVNHLQSMVRTVGAKIYKSAPEWDVLPATTDAVDLQTSQISNQVLQSNWYKMLMDEKSMEILLWMLVTGNGFAQHTWDPDAGSEIILPGDEGVELEFDDLHVGETACEVVPPFEMMFDPRAVKVRDATWALRSRITNIDELREDFPRAEKIPLEKTSSSGHFLSFQDHLKGLTGRGTRDRFASSTLRDDRNTTVVHELWIPPRRRSKSGLKRGKFIVMAGGTILNGAKGQDFPYIHGELPFAHFVEIPIPGRLWGTSTLEQLMPLQANYNRTKSQLIENRNLMSRPKWFNPRGSGITGTSLTSQPGEIVHHNPGLRPEPVEPPNIPPYVQNMLVHDKQDMEDISGVHEVSRAEAPGQIRSGRGVLALVEQDESRLNTVVRMFEKAIERIGRQNLSVSAQYVTETRMSRIVGENDELLLLTYDGNNLVGPNSSLPGVNYFDVRVKTVAGMPHSRAAATEMLGQLVELGALNPSQNPSHQRLLFKLLSIGQTIDHLDQARVHRSRQLQEIERILQGEGVRAEEWHDHAVHLEVLNDFRNSARYDILPPQAKQALQLHAKQHEEWIAYAAVKPQILVRKATMAAMVNEGMGQAASAAQGEASNMLAGPGGGSPPAAKTKQIQPVSGAQVPTPQPQGGPING